MHPTLESIIITPISAHALAIRPLVLPATAVITVRSTLVRAAKSGLRRRKA